MQNQATREADNTPYEPITQELFEEVIGIGYDTYKSDEYSYGAMCYYYHYTCPIMGEGSIVNEYISEGDLAFQLKEWAYDKGYILNSEHRCCSVLMVSGAQKTPIYFNANREIEAINNASIWVFQQVKKKQLAGESPL